jgi:1-deoxy-D-xylulose-5-phosphate synthase
VGSGFHARRVRADAGARVCLIGIGKMVANCEKAAEELAAEGVACTVWDARLVQPLDQEMLANARRHELVVTVEDGVREGGAGMSIGDQVSTATTRVEVLGVPVKFMPHGKPDRILANLGLDADGIAASIRKALHF